MLHFFILHILWSEYEKPIAPPNCKCANILAYTMTTVNQEHATQLDRMEVHDSDSLQLYSAQTPNGIKVAVCLEELCDLRSYKEHFNYEAVSWTYVDFQLFS